MLNFGTESADKLSQRSWHYPIINDTDRLYQQRIIERALMKNSLVCLPTGLGKTFIGLVVMHNFYRWFPTRKIIFMAPTRPLVYQQYKAWQQQFMCQLNIHATEITGNLSPEKRNQAWTTHNIFFTTPQILENDLANEIVQKDSIICLIFDEAHKATGNYSYCSIVKTLREANITFRICALTATPGPNISSIQALINNLMIESIEYINESSDELKAFTSQRNKQIISIPPYSSIETIKSILDDLIKRLYVFPLQKLGINLNSDIDNINISSLLNKKYSGAVEGYLAGLRVMLHLRDLLIFYGINSMLSYVSSLENDPKLTPLKSRIKKQLSESELFNRTIIDLHEKAKNIEFVSHPKLGILGRILERHFTDNKPDLDTRAMVFSNYRDSVLEICNYLQIFSPLLKPTSLLGQTGHDDSNKIGKLKQQKSVEDFLEGKCNIMVATCIGEEGLDIGFVDLIVFYDVHSSPIRLVQRSGRTGRKRDGQIIILVNEKKEMSLLEHSEAASRIIENAMINSNSFFKFIRQENNPVDTFSAAPQIVKFKLNNIKEKKPERSSVKRNLSFIPRNLLSVSKLDSSTSIITKLTSNGLIGHSSSTQSIVSVTSQFHKQDTNNSKCQLVWKSGLQLMPIFKIYNYEANRPEDYKLFFDTITINNFKLSTCTSDELLPDSFFGSDNFDFTNENSIINDNQSLNYKNNSSNQFLEPIFDESVLDEFDWSDSEF